MVPSLWQLLIILWSQRIKYLGVKIGLIGFKNIFETIEDLLKLWEQSGVSWISFKAGIYECVICFCTHATL